VLEIQRAQIELDDRSGDRADGDVAPERAQQGEEGREQRAADDVDGHVDALRTVKAAGANHRRMSSGSSHARYTRSGGAGIVRCSRTATSEGSLIGTSRQGSSARNSWSSESSCSCQYRS